MRLVVGITGATGVVFGIRILEELRLLQVETHLCISSWGRKTLEHEADRSIEEVRRLADHSHPPGDMGAVIASGSYLTDGMVIAPCSTRSLAAIATGTGDNLITRAADVTLKEGRKLVLLVREAPLSEIHLSNMLTLARMRAVVLPPVPAFYNRPQSLAEVVDHVVYRTLDQFGLGSDHALRWNGEMSNSGSGRRAVTPPRPDSSEA